MLRFFLISTALTPCQKTFTGYSWSKSEPRVRLQYCGCLYCNLKIKHIRLKKYNLKAIWRMLCMSKKKFALQDIPELQWYLMQIRKTKQNNKHNVCGMLQGLSMRNWNSSVWLWSVLCCALLPHQHAQYLFRRCTASILCVLSPPEPLAVVVKCHQLRKWRAHW